MALWTPNYRRGYYDGLNGRRKKRGQGTDYNNGHSHGKDVANPKTRTRNATAGTRMKGKGNPRASSTRGGSTRGGSRRSYGRRSR